MGTKTAIGVSAFKKLVEESTVFIDKTLLIKEFIENPAEVILVTCPRRWGKTINMNMIKTFLEIEFDRDGNRYDDKKQTNNYKLFHGEINLGNVKTEKVEKPLNIAQYSNIINSYQGEYPVISIDFKNVKGTNYQEIVNRTKLAISNVFTQHKYILDSLLNSSINSQSTYSVKETATEHLHKFRRLFANDAQKATDIDIESSLKFLSELLYCHFDKKVYVLLDEYDTPINNILQSLEFSKQDLERTLMLFRTILGTTFKGNENLEKGLITGVFRIAKSSLFSDLNNIVEYNFLNNQFAKYYGFTEDDIEYLFSEYKITAEDKQKALNWYDGYRVTIDPTLKIYNPWAIVNYLSTKIIRNYWEETGNIDFIKKLFNIDQIKKNIETLLSSQDDDDSILVKLEDLKFSKDDFLLLKALIDKGDNYEIKNEIVDLFFRFIFAAGYLTIADKQMYKSKITSIRIPNNEIKSELENKLVSYYDQVYNIGTKLFTNVTDELVKIISNQDTNKLKKSLDDLFKAFPEFSNITKNTEVKGVHGNEDLIHSVINFTALQIKGLSKFGTEVWYKNQGRADIILINDNTKSGMIIELKYNGSADEALEQTNKYLMIFKEHTHIKTIISLGINVSVERQVDIKTKLQQNPNYPQALIKRMRNHLLTLLNN